jgi:hypothetical protein
MATTDTASIITLHQPRPKTPAERAKAYRDRKAGKATEAKPVTKTVTGVTPVTPVTASRPVTKTVTASRRPVASYLLIAASFGLAAVGITMNGWFAKSLGSSEIAGWLFLAVGVAADLVALAIPAAAGRHWQTRQRGVAVAGWAIWLATFAFAITAGIGFASVNISDVTLSRASRVTPAVTTAQAALSDAIVARDRECKGGVGKFCREREQAVADRRQALDVAMVSVERTADPQTEAASHIVAWVSRGLVKPSGDDFAMLRLILLAFLPQVGGILLMVARV